MLSIFIGSFQFSKGFCPAKTSRTMPEESFVAVAVLKLFVVTQWRYVCCSETSQIFVLSYCMLPRSRELKRETIEQAQMHWRKMQGEITKNPTTRPTSARRRTFDGEREDFKLAWSESKGVPKNMHGVRKFVGSLCFKQGLGGNLNPLGSDFHKNCTCGTKS